ncbi:Nucleolar complex-associated protein 3 [Coniochaeta hoffmannii]|uniref:Nucleolar complex-associated protein 3 n=1 Tax=Coniochaeta hoffmannii TaxID=91930 RepID=A0AA38VB49_9PEZI|nr:Nucleolar complex-associated protein 3 [Coniochaeta hoffmannii]
MASLMASRPSKRRKLTPPPSDEDSGAKVTKAFFRNAASWNLEQDYESRPRKGKKKEKESSRLPVKTADGRIEQLRTVQDDVLSVASDDDWANSDGDDADVPDEPERPVPVEPQLPPGQQLRNAQEELAKIASLLNEDPEEHPGAFKALAKVGQSSSLQSVQKLALVTQMAVYRDVIPGYRIRPASEDAPEEKLSKEVRKVRTYEQALVAGYQAYIKDLAHWATQRPSNQKEAGKHISTVAITCACTLLNAVPHFNFRGELIRILVRKLSNRRPDALFAKCRKSLETLFKEDEEGRPSLEAVSLLAKMMKARDYNVHESVLNLFLNLRLLSEFSGKASADQVERRDDTANEVMPKGMKQRQKREFRNKKLRKELKEQKALQKDMEKADASVSHEERDRMQSDTLKLVFATYFRILKLRSPHLMGATLEGLAKYAHLINQDFFGDLLEALKDLIRYTEADAEAAEGDEADAAVDDDDPVVRNPSREALLCTVTAFALLAGQDAHDSRSTLHLDLSYFTTHLYRSLYTLSLNPDLELNSKSLHLSDPNDPSSSSTTTAKNKVNIQTTTVLLVRCLSAVLLPPWNIRSVPPLRIAAFTKQLVASALHVPEKSCQAVLALLNDVTHVHGKKISALWNTEERKGDGTFNPLSDSVEGSNPFASTVWEGELLKRHYCPKVREGVKVLEKSLRSLN